MNAWGVSNQKGGVAKSTNTINLAGAAAARGHDVLAVDTDPQGYLTNYLGLRDAYTAGGDDDEDVVTFYDAWKEPTKNDPTEAIVGHDEFDVLPSNLDMFNLEQDLIAEGWRVRERLSMIFDRLPAYDMIFVDAPPSLGPINDNVLLATENVVIPMEAKEASVLALDHLLTQVETLEERFEVNIHEEAVIISDVDYPLDNEQTDMIEWIRDTFDDRAPVYEVRNRAAIARAQKAGQSITTYDEECDQEPVYQDVIEGMEASL